MCGIIAYSGNDNFLIDKITNLLLYNTTRGTDGSGWYNDGKITKGKDDVFDLLKKNITNIKKEKIFIGHTRNATSGGKNDNNSHPFEYGSIIGVHNGSSKMLLYQLCQQYSLQFKDIDVDSQVLIQQLSLNNGYKILKEWDGPIAVVFVNKTTPDILYCFRNHERPLFRGKIGNNVYISSLEESLSIIGCEKIKEFKQDFLYKIKDGKIIDTKLYKKSLPIVKKETPVAVTPQDVNTVDTDTHPLLTWAKCDNTSYGLIKDKHYLILNEHKSKDEILIQNEFGAIVAVDKWSFSFPNDDIYSGCFVKSLINGKYVKRCQIYKVISRTGQSFKCDIFNKVSIDGCEKISVVSSESVSQTIIAPEWMFRSLETNEISFQTMNDMNDTITNSYVPYNLNVYEEKIHVEQYLKEMICPVKIVGFHNTIESKQTMDVIEDISIQQEICYNNFKDENREKQVTINDENINSYYESVFSEIEDIINEYQISLEPTVDISLSTLSYIELSSLCKNLNEVISKINETILIKNHNT